MATEDNPYSTTTLITRFQTTSDENPPWAGISFELPVGSDELADKLRLAYPDSTLRQRKHMAAIDFLKNELFEMRQEASRTSASEKHNAFTPQVSLSFSNDIDVRSRQGSVSSSLSLTSMNQGASSQEHGLLRSGAQSTITDPKVTDPVKEIIFSVSDGRPMQPKTKKKMTKEEKIVYKKTRKRGACSRCRRQKGKCTHVQDPAIENDEVVGLSSAQKRSLSLDASSEQAQANKMLRTTGFLDPHTPRVGASTHPSHSFLPTPSTAHKFSVYQQPERTPEDLRSSEAVDGDVCGGQSRYVLIQNLEDLYGFSNASEPASSWQNQSLVTSPQSVDPDPTQYGILPLAGDAMRIPPTPDTSPMQYSYQNGTFSSYLEEPWHDLHGNRSEDMEPT